MSDIQKKINFMKYLNAMILLPDKPLPGDFIALDWDGTRPEDFKQGISWYCSQVLETNGDFYKVKYNDEWYKFENFGTPKPSNKGNYNVYPAIPA